MGLMMLDRNTHTAEPLVLEPNAFGVELATQKRKSHKSPCIDHIPAELIKAGRTKLQYENIIVPLKGWKSSNIWEQR
jgi:hypothetical protein